MPRFGAKEWFAAVSVDDYGDVDYPSPEGILDVLDQCVACGFNPYEDMSDSFKKGDVAVSFQKRQGGFYSVTIGSESFNIGKRSDLDRRICDVVDKFIAKAAVTEGEKALLRQYVFATGQIAKDVAESYVRAKEGAKVAYLYRREYLGAVTSEIKDKFVKLVELALASRGTTIVESASASASDSDSVVPTSPTIATPVMGVSQVMVSSSSVMTGGENVEIDRLMSQLVEGVLSEPDKEDRYANITRLSTYLGEYIFFKRSDENIGRNNYSCVIVAGEQDEDHVQDRGTIEFSCTCDPKIDSSKLCLVSMPSSDGDEAVIGKLQKMALPENIVTVIKRGEGDYVYAKNHSLIKIRDSELLSIVDMFEAPDEGKSKVENDGAIGKEIRGIALMGGYVSVNCSIKYATGGFDRLTSSEGEPLYSVVMPAMGRGVFDTHEKEQLRSFLQDRMTLGEIPRIFGDGRVYRLPGGEHTWLANLSWALARMHRGSEFVVCSDISAKHLLRSSKDHEGQVSGFAREVATVAMLGYKGGFDKLGRAKLVPDSDSANLSLSDVIIPLDELAKAYGELVASVESLTDVSSAAVLSTATSSVSTEEPKVTAVVTPSPPPPPPPPSSPPPISFYSSDAYVPPPPSSSPPPPPPSSPPIYPHGSVACVMQGLYGKDADEMLVKRQIDSTIEDVSSKVSSPIQGAPSKDPSSLMGPSGVEESAVVEEDGDGAKGTGGHVTLSDNSDDR